MSAAIDRERRRLLVLRAMRSGTLTLERAAGALRLSPRQVRRIYQRFLAEGARGVVHRGRGRPSNQAFAPSVRALVLRRWRETAMLAGPTHLARMVRAEGLPVDHETIRRWILAAGGTSAASRRPSRPAMPRTSVPALDGGFGELLTFDLHPGRWLGPGRPACGLAWLLDEATRTGLCALHDGDAPGAALALLQAWIDRYGIPAALRCPARWLAADRGPTLDEQLAGARPRSRLGTACRRLGVETRPLHAAAARAFAASLAPAEALVRGQLLERGFATAAAATRFLQDGLQPELHAALGPREAAGGDFHVRVMDRTDLRAIFAADRPREVRAAI